jgi:Carbohydrate family 9 binding domain-like
MRLAPSRLLLTAGITATLLVGLSANRPTGKTSYRAPQAAEAPFVDGNGADECWAKAEWRALDQCLLGLPVPAADFSGRYKVVWTAEKLFVLAEITDDVQRDTHRDPLKQYYDDDCLEIFVDPDASGGDHQYNNQAYAYHVALDGHVVDIGSDRKPRLFDQHVKSKWTREGTRTVWEAAITLYPASYDSRKPAASKPLPILAGKPIGFMLAYCDNDTQPTRENFYGSEPLSEVNANRGWIDASIFGTLLPVRR